MRLSAPINFSRLKKKASDPFMEDCRDPIAYQYNRKVMQNLQDQERRDADSNSKTNLRTQSVNEEEIAKKYFLVL